MTKRLLVVEDEDDLRMSVAEVLRMEGYEVTEAADGREALERLGEGALPNLIILDLMMPVMDGWTFRAEQRQDDRLVDIPVLIFTSAKNLAEVETELDPVGILEKPVSIGTLLEAIGKHV